MQDSIDLNQLREAYLQVEEATATRVVAILLSLVLFGFVLWLVRRRALREEYTPVWIGVSILMVVLSIRLDLLTAVTRALGAWTISSTLFFLGQVFLVVICLNYAARLSKYGSQLKNLAQEIAILRAQLELDEDDDS